MSDELPSDDPMRVPRARHGRAPDVFRTGAWVPMREYRDDETVDFAIVGTGAGGGTLACKLAEAGFSVVALDAGAYWRPLEDFASDETEQNKLFWNDERICDGDVADGQQQQRQVGRRQHRPFRHGVAPLPAGMVQVAVPAGIRRRLAARLARDVALLRRGRTGTEDRRPRPVPMGTGTAPLPLPPARGQRGGSGAGKGRGSLGYPLVADSAGDPFSTPWHGAPLRLSWLLRAGLLDQRQAERAADVAAACDRRRGGNPRSGDGRADRGQRRRAGDRRSLPPRGRMAVPAGAERGGGGLRDRDTAAAAEFGDQPLSRWPRQQFRSGRQIPDGAVQSGGLGVMDEEVRWYKGPPSLALSEHWNNTDEGKDFFGGYAFMSQGPLPMAWATTQSVGRGLWGQKLLDEMEKYNHQAGLKIVGETLPQERNQVTLADEKDGYGLPIPRITYSFCDNDRRLIDHSIRYMTQVMECAGAREIWPQMEDTAHLHGTARMGDDPRTSVVDADCRSWDIRNLWICDGSVFPMVGGVNPSLTIQAIACRTGDRIREMAKRGDL